MDITRFAINNTRTTGVALALLAIAGFDAYNKLPRAEDPGFVVRTAQIVTYFPGASPDRIENLISDRLEKSIKEMPELDSVTSTSKTGVSVVLVNIRERYKNMRPIWDSLRRKVDGVRSQLPDGTIGPFVNDEFGDVFGIVLTVTGEGYSGAELKDVADEMRDEMLQLPDAAKVSVHGAANEQIFVEYNNARLSESGLTPFALKQILESRNIIIPGGAVDTDVERITLEPSGNFESLEDLKKTVIALPGRGVIYLQDLARISRGYDDPPQVRVTSSGETALALAISLREGGNITDLGDQVKALIPRLEEQYPIGIELDVVAFQPDQVNKKVDDFVESLLQSIGIVLLVMLLTLGLRTGLLVASLIPMTMLVSLLLMDLFGIGLDQISLASLIIALGMLVDNAIVMSESIMVQMATGKTATESAIESAKELRVPLLVASLTTSASFLPIFLAKSAVGEYTASIFKVVTIALLSSWVLALTMTPLLCVMFLRIKKGPSEEESFKSLGYRVYRRILRLILNHRMATLGVTLVVFIGVMGLFPQIPFLFFPPADRPLITVRLEMPIGTRIEQTMEVSDGLDAFLEKERERGVVNWAAFVGEGAPKFVLGYNPEPPSPVYGYVLINMKDFESTEALLPQIEDFLFETYPDLSAKVSLLNYGPPVNNPVEVRLYGRDVARLFENVEAVKAKLGTLPGPRNVKDNWGLYSKKLEVAVNQPRARRAATSNQEVAISLQTVLSGIETTQYREDDKVIPIVLRSVSADRRDLGKIESLSVFSSVTGKNVPLKQVADVRLAFQPAKILRRNQLKAVTVSAQLAPGYSSKDVNDVIIPWLKEQQNSWPLGYSFDIGGESEASDKGNKSIAEQLPIAALIIILLLVGQFNSIRRAAIIGMTIPLGLIGVVLGLLIARSYFGFMTFLGIVSLAGIVINNAIVLLDRINLELADGHPPPLAVVRAAQLRMRPILLTTATTIGGLIPLWAGGGAMFEPMAVAIIFGMAFSTLLTLGVVPVLYSLLFRVRYTGSEFT